MTVPATDWMIHAACRGLGKTMFPDPADRARIADAVRVCAGCPVQIDCAVLARGERNGVWAGKLHERPQRESRVA